MPRVLLLLTLLATFPALGQEWDEVTEEVQAITPSDAAEDDHFGSAVDVASTVAVIGALADDDNGLSSGSVYIYCLDAVTNDWDEVQKLIPSDGDRSDQFGVSVSVSGEVVLVGSYRDDESGDDSGSAYVFRFDSDGDEWIKEQNLTASDGEQGDFFGASVSVFDDVAIIGAHGNDQEGDAAGSAYVFRFDGDEWVEEQKLSASDAGDAQLFGDSVSVDGTRAIVGAPGDDFRSGAAYVFFYDEVEAEWIEEQKLTASDGAIEDVFGYSVDILDDVVVLGAMWDDEEGSDSGSTYVFRYDEIEELWTEEQKLTASDGAEDDLFGWSVSVSESAVIVGSVWDDDNGDDSGAAYVYAYSEGDEEWLEVQKLVAAAGNAQDHFGLSVAASDRFVFVGSPHGDDTGVAYFFRTTTPFLRGDVNGDGDVDPLPDALYLLEWSFSDSDRPTCMEAADVNDDGFVAGLLDSLHLLQYGFTDGDEPPDPGPDECGVDPTSDELFCDTAPDRCL